MEFMGKLHIPIHFLLTRVAVIAAGVLVVGCSHREGSVKDGVGEKLQQ